MPNSPSPVNGDDKGYLRAFEFFEKFPDEASAIAYFDFYNHERPHQSLNYRTPAEEHFVL